MKPFYCADCCALIGFLKDEADFVQHYPQGCPYCSRQGDPVGASDMRTRGAAAAAAPSDPAKAWWKKTEAEARDARAAKVQS